MYSELFKTIFVHIPRTGGQSVETAFLEKQGLNWQTRGALLLRRNPHGDRPRNLAHLLAKEYVELGHVSADVFASSLKFTVARHPFDRMLSAYRYKAQRSGITFTGFVRLLTGEKRDRHLIPASDYIVDDSGSVIVDKVIRFESLSRDFEVLSREIFGSEVRLPHVNRSEASVPPDAFKPEVRDIVYRQFERDFDLFQYPRGVEFHHISPSSQE